jgi:PAS domain S-box-containing protein
MVHGAMSLATTVDSNRHFDNDDLALAEQLGRRSAVAIQNARLYRDVHAAEARYRGLFEGTNDGIIVFDPDGNCVDVNPAMTRMVGYDRAELVGFPATLVARGGPWSGEEGERLRREGQWRGDFELRRKNGAIMAVESSITSVPLPTGSVYVGVLRDISERRRFERLQEEFLSALAHDLMNPLTTVRGQTQLQRRRIARGESLDEDRLAAALESIDTASLRMSRLLDELADVMRLRAGSEIDLHRDTTDLVALTRRTANEHGRATERHRIEVVSEVDALFGFWDGPRLERVLGNLVGNAIKYSPQGGEITIRIAREGNGDAEVAALIVEDCGVGIPAADQSLIFERFRRAGNVESFAGSGIGLAGAKRIVELHGGTIGVTSTEGRGSMFTVRLPMAVEDD